MLIFETDYETDLKLSNFQKQFILCSKSLFNKCVDLTTDDSLKENEKYYRYKVLVSKALMWRYEDVQLEDVLKYTIKVYKKLLSNGLIRNDEKPEEVLCEKLLKCYNKEELINDLLSEIQWMDLEDEFFKYLCKLN